MIKKGADLQMAEAELKDIIQTDRVDLNVVEAKLKTIVRRVTDIRLSRIKALEELMVHLTTEQSKNLKEFLDMGPMAGAGAMMGCPLHDGLRIPYPPPLPLR